MTAGRTVTIEDAVDAAASEPPKHDSTIKNGEPQKNKDLNCKDLGFNRQEWYSTDWFLRGNDG
jgi:hypothetical protein